MRPANFQIEGSIWLQKDGRDFDRHNDFLFAGFSYSIADRVVELRWGRSAGIPASLLLSCRGVTHLSASARDPEMPFTEDDCLSGISFALPDSPLEHAFLTSYAAPVDPAWHWLFSFMSGFTLRVAGASVDLSAQET